MIPTRRTILIAAALPLALAACAPSASTSAGIAAAEQGLTVAEQSALIYTTLPRCPAATICSQQATVDRLKALDNTAYGAVVAARSNPAVVSAAWSAIMAFSSAIPTSR